MNHKNKHVFLDTVHFGVLKILGHTLKYFYGTNTYKRTDRDIDVDIDISAPLQIAHAGFDFHSSFGAERLGL